MPGTGFPADPEFGSGPWADLAPHLDAALNRLPAGDRDAVVLRFFEKRGFPAMAAALNISEDAARMRTNRALEKLRRLLVRHQQARGSAAALTAASLAILLRENSIASLPNGVAGPAAADAASRVAAAALGKASAAMAPAAVGAGAGVMMALRAWLVSQKTALLGSGALVAAAGAVWWFNHRLDAAGTGSGVVTAAAAWGTKPGIPGTGGTVAGGKQVDITVDYLLVPEAQALSLLNQRWNGDGDTELRAALLKQSGGSPSVSGSGSGVRLAKSLTGTFVSGTTQTLEDAVILKSPTAKVKPPPPGVVLKDGREGNPDGFELRKVGTVAELHAVVSVDGEWCTLKVRSTHHFGKPQTIQWSAAPAGASELAAGAEADDGRRMEFRGATADLYAVQRIGSSSLVQSSQLPAAPDATADAGPGAGAVTSSGSPVWLFTFLTIQPASLP